MQRVVRVCQRQQVVVYTESSTVMYVDCALLCTLGFIRGGLLKITLRIVIRSLYFDILFLAVVFHCSITFYFSALLIQLRHECFIS